jgi:hypothetical protein
MTWSDAILLQRIDDRCAELGVTRHAACVAGGVDPSYLDRDVNGRQIDKLDKLAAGLNWTLCQMIGCDSPTLAMQSVDRQLLEKAARTAQRGLRNDPDSAELLPGTIADVYELLIERQQSGEPIDDAYLAGIEGMIKRGRR